MKRSVVVLTILLVVGLFASTAFASGIIDFTLSPTSTAGAVSYAGGANPLDLTAIPVTSVAGIGTPLNNGVNIPIIGGELFFQSGNFNAGLSSSTTWVFDPNAGLGVLIGLTSGGCIDVDKDNACTGSTDITDSLLAIGNVGGNPTVLDLGGTSKIAGAIGLDIKDPALTALFGLPGGDSAIYNYLLNYSFKATGTP